MGNVLIDDKGTSHFYCRSCVQGGNVFDAMRRKCTTSNLYKLGVDSG